MKLHQLLALSLLIGVQGQTANDVNKTSVDHAGGHKPHIVVFLANAKVIANSDNQTEKNYANPFQRMIQFFLSNVLRDFSLDRNETSVAREKKDLWGDIKSGTVNFTTKAFNETKKGLEATRDAFHGAADTLRQMNSSYREQRCFHGEEGFCKSCTKKIDKRKVEKPISTTTEKSKKRHYFLSISGDTDKRVAASLEDNAPGSYYAGDLLQPNQIPFNLPTFSRPKTTDNTHHRPEIHAPNSTPTRFADQDARIPRSASITTTSTNKDSGIQAADTISIHSTDPEPRVDSVSTHTTNQDPTIGIADTEIETISKQVSVSSTTKNISVGSTNSGISSTKKVPIGSTKLETVTPKSKSPVSNVTTNRKSKQRKPKKKLDIGQHLINIELEDRFSRSNADSVNQDLEIEMTNETKVYLANQDSKIKTADVTKVDSVENSQFPTILPIDSTNQHSNDETSFKDFANRNTRIRRAHAIPTDSTNRKSTVQLVKATSIGSNNQEPLSIKIAKSISTDSTSQKLINIETVKAISTGSANHELMTIQVAEPTLIGLTNQQPSILPNSHLSRFEQYVMDFAKKHSRFQKGLRVPTESANPRSTKGLAKTTDKTPQTLKHSTNHRPRFRRGDAHPPSKSFLPFDFDEIYRDFVRVGRAEEMTTSATAEGASTVANVGKDGEDDDANTEENMDSGSEVPMFPPDQVARPKVKTDYLTTFTYLLTVTLPTVIFFGAAIVGMCFIFRMDGFCCKLFLTIPSENQTRKKRIRLFKIKKKKKKQEKIIVQST